MPKRREALAVAAAFAAAIALGGCGIGAGRTPKGLQLTVTTDFGAHEVMTLKRPKAEGQETVMSLLRRNAKVETKYGGGFVQSIDGRAGGRGSDGRMDWFYYVNGVEAEKGAAATVVKPGERIWWDMHAWGEAQRVPAVVGSFPQPFMEGPEGKHMPVRLECAKQHGEACKTVVGRLDALGVVAGYSLIGPSSESPYNLQLLVGTVAQLSTSPAARLLRRAPSVSGVYAHVVEGGRKIQLLDQDGVAIRTVGGGTGLIVATEFPEQAAAWIVTGTDEAAVRNAARHFNAASLDGHFAVAVLPSGKVLPLPVRDG